jgi:hypothetical protein
MLNELCTLCLNVKRTPPLAARRLADAANAAAGPAAGGAFWAHVAHDLLHHDRSFSLSL